MVQEAVAVYFDGGSRGNPGPAAGAAYTAWQGGRERSCFIPSATNNEAEYRGLLMAIELAKELELAHVSFLGDSKLVVMQVSGEWQAKHPMMQELREQALRALTSIPRWQIGWIGRALNSEADRIANEEMDRQLGVQPHAPLPTAQPPLPKAEGSPATRPDIEKINRLGNKAGFGDLKQLKVGGMDGFSRVSISGLQELLINFHDLHDAFHARLQTDKLTESLPDAAAAKLLLQALRWSARGLEGDLALRKVLVDLEVSNNVRGKKR